MELNIDKPKKLTFSVSLADVDISAIKGSFVIYLEKGVHLGFDVKVMDGKVIAEIPSLLSFNFENEKKYKAELWVIADPDYFTIPWSEEILIRKPVNIKTDITIKEESDPYVLVTKPIITKE